MAQYRKLVIDGTTYHFTLSKKFVNIRSKILVSNVNVEKSVLGFEYNGEIVVTPKMIANYILGKPKLKLEECFSTCECKDVPKSLSAILYDAEISQKTQLVIWCEQCLDESSWDI